MVGGQRSGLGSRTPDSKWLITCPFSIQKNGCWPSEKISHAQTASHTQRNRSLSAQIKAMNLSGRLVPNVFQSGCAIAGLLPNIHTSLAAVKRLKLMDSGAIHLIGSRLIEASTHAIEHLPSYLCDHCVYMCVHESTFVVLLLLYKARKAEVSELDTFGRCHQDIPHCNVSATQDEKNGGKLSPFRRQMSQLNVSTPLIPGGSLVTSRVFITCAPC